MIDPRITAALTDAKARADLRAAVVAAARSAGVQVVAQATATQTVETPANESQLGALLDAILPQVLAGVAQARAALSDKKISLLEAASLAQTIIAVVSVAVRDGAPAVRGQNARALVIAVFGVVFDRYVADLLPAWLRPFSGLVRSAAVFGLQSAYDALIKK